MIISYYCYLYKELYVFSLLKLLNNPVKYHVSIL